MGWRVWRRADAQPHNASPSARRAGMGDDHGGHADPAAVLRVRARRRLIGAAALLLAVAVVLPKLLDKEPRPVTDSIPIDIPSDKTPFAPRLALPPVSETRSAPISPLPDSAPAEQGKGEPTPEADRTEPSAKPVEKTEKKPPAPQGSKAADRAAEDARARAILEGRSGDATSRAPAGDGRYLLQAAALGSESAARELAARLKKAGFASFTERTDTKDGVRYRVRLGPFATRDEAERARARLRAIGINASLVTA